MAGSISLEKPGFWRARIGAAEQLNAPELHPASCVSIQPVFKSGLSTCCHTETIAEPLLMRFQPLRRAKCGSTGNAAVGAFAFQRRCFVRVFGAGGNQRANPRASRPEARRTETSNGNVVYEAQAPTVVSTEDSRHSHKAPSPSGRALTQQMGECRRRTHQSDALYSRARRANFQTVSQEQSYKVMVGLALRNRGALEIMKSDAMRAVVLPGWPNGEHHPMGPCYVSLKGISYERRTPAPARAERRGHACTWRLLRLANDHLCPLRRRCCAGGGSGEGGELRYLPLQRGVWSMSGE